MKNMFTKLLAGLLAVMLLMTSSVAFMEEMPGVQSAILEENPPTIDEKSQAEPAEDTTEPNIGDAPEPASDDAAEPDTDAPVPNADAEKEDAVISSEPVDAFVEESEDADLLDLPMLEAQCDDDELDLDALEENSIDNDTSPMLMELMEGTIDLSSSEIIPDARFRAYLAYQYDTDRNGVLSEAEIANVTEIYTADVQNMDEDYYQAHAQELENAGVHVNGSAGFRYFSWDIQDMTGITIFHNLRSLILGDIWGDSGNIPELDISNLSSMEYVNCDNIQLTSLNASGCVNLKELLCRSNQIKTLKLNGCASLYRLYCNDNQIESFDISDCVALKYLQCENNKLTHLNVDSCSNLIRLDCSTNPLTSLNVSNCPLLEHLYCYNCDLSSLTLNNPLIYVLLAFGNNLTELNIENSPDLVYASNTEAQTNAELGENTLIYTDYFYSNIYLGLIQYRDFQYYCLAVDNTVTLVPAPTDTRIVELTSSNFEDGKFLEFVKSNYDKNKDNWLSQSEIADVTVMQLNHDDPVTEKTVGEGITSLKGIEFFSALKELDCGYNELTTLDLSQNSGLKEVLCWDNKLTILNVAGLSRLTRLSCSNNQLAELIVKDNIKLKELDCSCNLLKSINLKNNAGLYELYIEQNQIDILDISNNPWLVACIKNPKYYDTVDNGRIIMCATDPDFYDDEMRYDAKVTIILDDGTVIPGVNIDDKPADTGDSNQNPAPAPAPAPAAVAPAPAPAPAPAEPITISKTPASTKAKAKKGKVTVTWKKIKKSKKTKALLGQIKSIQVQYSTDPNFTTDVNTKTVGKKKTKAVLKLQRKTQYYVRVRYVGSDGVSNWGAVKGVKTK